MCVVMVVGDGVADFVIAVAFVVTSDLHTAVDSVEFDFAVDAFCGTIFSALGDIDGFTCNAA